MAAFIIPVFKVINMALNLYWWVIIIMAVMSWLLAFDVINMRNELVRSIWNLSNALTEPVLRPIRRFMPPHRRHGYFADRLAAAAVLRPDGAGRRSPTR